MKYKLTKDWLDYKKGHVFDGKPFVEETFEYENLDFGTTVKTIKKTISDVELSLLLHTGILEEVTEERWKPQDGEGYWYVDGYGELMKDEWSDCVYDEDLWKYGNCFRTEQEATIARDKVKELLLSLHNN